MTDQPLSEHLGMLADNEIHVHGPDRNWMATALRSLATDALALETELSRLREAVEAVRALHPTCNRYCLTGSRRWPRPHCNTCWHDQPCPTIRALDARDPQGGP